MGKGVWIAIGIVLLITVGAGAFLINNRNISKTASPPSQNDLLLEDNQLPNSLRNLLGLGVNQMCTFQDAGTGDRGTVYVAGSRVRGDFSTQSDEGILNSHMIIDGDILSLWYDGAEGGVMMPFSQLTQEDEDNQVTDGDNVPNLDEPVDYRCSPWSVDEEKFVRPSEVTFENFTAVMEAQENTGGESTDQCVACNNLPQGDSRDQCLQILNCN